MSENKLIFVECVFYFVYISLLIIPFVLFLLSFFFDHIIMSITLVQFLLYRLNQEKIIRECRNWVIMTRKATCLIVFCGSKK